MSKMFWLTLLIVAPCIAISDGRTLTCTCWDGYRAEYHQNGAQCVATDQFHIMPCNMAVAPKCKCSGRVSSILKDRTGTWCTRYRKGEELKRWPCENVKEWDEFFRRHPDFF
nr:uncharacterized protein LOC111503600 [Leptinotarsa decemlineata]